MTRFLPFLIFFLLCAMLWLGLARDRTHDAQSALIGKPFPNEVLPPQGKVTMVNLFASWCIPCVAEVPTLMELKEKKLAPIIGIAWKNKPQDARAWLANHGNPYAKVIFDEKGDTTVPLALTGVPETFILGKDHKVMYHTAQPITVEQLHEEIIPLLERLQ